MLMDILIENDAKYPVTLLGEAADSTCICVYCFPWYLRREPASEHDLQPVHLFESALVCLVPRKSHSKWITSGFAIASCRAIFQAKIKQQKKGVMMHGTTICYLSACETSVVSFWSIKQALEPV